MSKRAVDAVFEGLFILTDIRVLLRETAPGHALDNGQRVQAGSLLDELERRVALLREELAP